MVNSVSNNSLSQTQGFTRRLQNQLSELGANKQAEPAVLTQNSKSSKFDLASASQAGGGVQASSQSAPPPGNLPRGSIVDVLV